MENCEVLCKALSDFGSRIESCRIDERKLPWCPMLPYVYPEYGTGRKIFYIGRDTFGWDLKLPGEEDEKCFDFFFKCYDAGDFRPYLKRNSGTLSVDKRVYGWYNKPGSFWFGINSLHLKLILGRDPRLGLRDLSKEELRCLNGIGYGNLNAIEFPETLKKQGYGCWSHISKDEYLCIKKSSGETLDKLKYVLACYHPDCVVIASLEGKSEDEYFAGCKVVRLGQEDSVSSHMKVRNYNVSYSGVEAKVFWTKHPAKWGWSWDAFTTNVNELANHISKSMGW